MTTFQFCSHLAHLCDECGKGFLTAPNLKKHKESSIHNKDAKTIQCTECPKTFLTMKNLKRHMLTHGKDKYYY